MASHLPSDTADGWQRGLPSKMARGLPSEKAKLLSAISHPDWIFGLFLILFESDFCKDEPNNPKGPSAE